MIKLDVIFDASLEQKMHRREEIIEHLDAPDLHPADKSALEIELGGLAAELATESEIAVRVAFSIRHARQKKTHCCCATA